MKTQPDQYGHFGIFGGRYAAETLMPALIELEKAYQAAKKIKHSKKSLNGISGNMPDGLRRFIMPVVCPNPYAEPKYI